jgi:hypothetical protein
MISITWLGNQWASSAFWDAVDAETDEAGKHAQGFERDDSERVVLACWLNYAVPAGNA